MDIPEILAPAGDRECLRAALAAGADAVYFGLDEGFNARARATNFPIAQLAEVVDQVHASGARAYLAVNTLVFESELEAVAKIVTAAARDGVDALIVQDPAVCLLARSICPELEIHASTQMTISSLEAIEFAQTLGVTRVVLPRELSLEEIARVRERTDVELEVFVAGALCVSWSGQCLSSETWGGRSANRGQCAQACRLPYDLIVDGEHRPLGDRAYLLSPQDLGAFGSLQRLRELGVHTLKIEGRQKDPEYVYTAVRAVKSALGQQELGPALRDLSLAYSRGFTEGFFNGSDHQELVVGRTPRHRGIFLGRVTHIQGSRVVVERSAGAITVDPAAGMGVAFASERPETQEEQQGGPIFGVAREGSEWVLTFGTPGPDLRRVAIGDEVWVTGDPSIARRVRGELNARPRGGNRVDVAVSGRAGEPLVAVARWHGGEARAASTAPLQAARGEGLRHELLSDKLATFGDTAFQLGELDLSGLESGLFVPVSELKRTRKALIEQLEAGFSVRRRTVAQAHVVQDDVDALEGPPQLVALCRQMEHLEAAIAAGVSEVILDWMELVGLKVAVERARSAGMRVGLATVRVQKPGEEAYDRRLAALAPDFVLVRHWAGLMHFSRADSGVEVEADFSLNVTNSLTARHLLSLGVKTLTAAHDLDEHQLDAMLMELPRGRMGVIVHHHIPTFHTEHCVYSHLLSQGRDYRTCGRPCEAHQVGLRDRKGKVHPVVVDVGCRNTVFNAGAQSAASLVPELLAAGMNRFRVELVRESAEEARTVLGSYAALLAGKMAPAEVIQNLHTHEQFGVTLGTMQVLQMSSFGE